MMRLFHTSFEYDTNFCMLPSAEKSLTDVVLKYISLSSISSCSFSYKYRDVSFSHTNMKRMPSKVLTFKVAETYFFKVTPKIFCVKMEYFMSCAELRVITNKSL